MKGRIVNRKDVYKRQLHNRLKGVGTDMIATTQKENIKEEKVAEKFSIISNRISDYRLKPRDYAVYCLSLIHILFIQCHLAER